MRAVIFASILLFQFVAIAAPSPFLTSKQIPPTTTTADKTYYVETTGNDAYDCTSISSPCLTIQGAINRVKGNAAAFTIRHGITISVGAGNFAGFVVSGITVAPPVSYGSQYAYFMIKGTLQDVGVSGTLASVTAQSGQTFATATDSGLALSVDANKGHYLEVLTGTGSTSTTARPARWLITSNTATVFTLVGSGLTALGASATYKLVKPATFITSGTTPATASGNPSNVSIPSNGIFGAAFVQNQGLGFVLRDLEFSMGASLTRGVVIQESRLAVTNCRFIATSSTVFPFVFSSTTAPSAAAVLFGVYSNLTGTSNSTHMSLGTTGGSSPLAAPAITSSMFEGGQYGLNISGAATGPLVNNCKFLSQTSAAMILLGVPLAQITSTRIDSSVTGVYASESSSQGLGSTTFGLASVDISNCSTAAVTLIGPLTGAFVGATVTGTGNAIGLQLSRGAKAAIRSSVTLTGTIEVSLDGTTTDLATMRAATPKVTRDANYQTIIYE